MKRILFAAGGSGGHLAPAIALAQRANQFGAESVIATTQKQVDQRLQECYPEYGFISIRGTGYDGSLLSLLKFTLGLLTGLWPTLKVISQRKVNLAVATGGFGCAPVALAAVILGIPVAIHESNSVPGKVTRLFRSLFDAIFVTRLFGSGEPGFRKAKTVGFPLRFEHSRGQNQGLFDFKVHNRLLTVFGGSQGARALTEFVENNESRWQSENINVVCVTGPVNYQPKQNVDSVRYVSFVEDMSALYKNTDLLIARSGAGSISEIAEYQCPVVLVPLPTSADNHQQTNAEAFVAAGCGNLLNQEDLNSFANEIVEFMKDESSLESMLESQRLWRTENRIGLLINYILAEKDVKWV